MCAYRSHLGARFSRSRCRHCLVQGDSSLSVPRVVWSNGYKYKRKKRRPVVNVDIPESEYSVTFATCHWSPLSRGYIESGGDSQHFRWQYASRAMLSTVSFGLNSLDRRYFVGSGQCILPVNHGAGTIGREVRWIVELISMRQTSGMSHVTSPRCSFLAEAARTCGMPNATPSVHRAHRRRARRMLDQPFLRGGYGGQSAPARGQVEKSPSSRLFLWCSGDGNCL